MVTPQFFDAPDFAHWRVPASKKPGSFIRRSKRGRGRGGASSAARKAFHCAVFSPKVRRSARASSARANALSRTNSLTERLEAAAAARNAVLALRVSRRSSFSVRRERDGMATPSFSRLSFFARQCQDRTVMHVVVLAVRLPPAAGKQKADPTAPRKCAEDSAACCAAYRWNKSKAPASEGGRYKNRPRLSRRIFMGWLLVTETNRGWRGRGRLVWWRSARGVRGLCRSRRRSSHSGRGRGPLRG